MAVVLVVVLIMISVITDDHVFKHKWSVPIFIRTMELWVYISKNLKLDDELNLWSFKKFSQSGQSLGGQSVENYCIIITNYFNVSPYKT